VDSARPRLFARPALFAVMLAALMVAGTLPAEASESETDRIVRVAKNQLGDPWAWGRVGPRSFDCSGLVYFVFRKTGLLKRIGGQRRSVDGYWDWFRKHGRTSRAHGRRGDLVVWGNGRHIGIYLGRGRAISTLTSGVRTHRLHNLTTPFTTFLRVRLERG